MVAEITHSVMHDPSNRRITAVLPSEEKKEAPKKASKPRKSSSAKVKGKTDDK